MDFRAWWIWLPRAVWRSSWSCTGMRHSKVCACSCSRCAKTVILGAMYPWPPQQRPMPDVDHTPAFWSAVATAYKDYSNVIFDLHNEPYPDNNQGTRLPRTSTPCRNLLSSLVQFAVGTHRTNDEGRFNSCLDLLARWVLGERAGLPGGRHGHLAFERARNR